MKDNNFVVNFILTGGGTEIESFISSEFSVTKSSNFQEYMSLQVHFLKLLVAVHATREISISKRKEMKH